MRGESGAEEDKEEGLGWGQGAGGVHRLGGPEGNDRERVPAELGDSGPACGECGPFAGALLCGAAEARALYAHEVPGGGRVDRDSSYASTE